MMETLNIRQKLHQYVDNGDEKLLKMMFAIAKEYNEDNDIERMSTDEDIKLFDERRAKRLNGESDRYNWQEAKDIIIRK